MSLKKLPEPKNLAEFIDRLPTNVRFMYVREPSTTIIRLDLHVGDRVVVSRHVLDNDAIRDSTCLVLQTACRALASLLDSADAALYAQAIAATREREARG